MSIRAEIERINNGVFTRVRYKSDMTSKLKAAYRNDGYSVEKITETTARTGCNYGNIHNVIIKKANGTLGNSNKDIYEWIVPNKIKRHKEKGTEYLVMDTIPLKQSHTNTKYIVRKGNSATVTDNFNNIVEMFVPSATKQGDRPDVMTIKMENILSFNHVS